MHPPWLCLILLFCFLQAYLATIVMVVDWLVWNRCVRFMTQDSSHVVVDLGYWVWEDVWSTSLYLITSVPWSEPLFSFIFFWDLCKKRQEQIMRRTRKMRRYKVRTRSEPFRMVTARQKRTQEANSTLVRQVRFPLKNQSSKASHNISNQTASWSKRLSYCSKTTYNSI